MRPAAFRGTFISPYARKNGIVFILYVVTVSRMVVDKTHLKNTVDILVSDIIELIETLISQNFDINCLELCSIKAFK